MAKFGSIGSMKNRPLVWARAAIAVGPTCAIALLSPILAPAARALPASFAAVAPLELAQASPASLQEGQRLYELGQIEAAIAVWQETLQAAEARGDRLRQGLSWNYLAIAHRDQNRLELAAQAMTQSLQFLAPSGTEPTEATARMAYANALLAQGSLQLRQGQAETALETWEAAEAIYRELGDDLGQAGVQMNQVQAMHSLGLYRRAQQLLDRARATLDPAPASDLKALALQNLGATQHATGNYEGARTAFAEGLTIAESLEAPALTAAILINLGNTQQAQSNPEGALQSYQRAIALGPTPLTRLQAQLNLLDLQLQTQQGQAARETLAQIRDRLPTLEPSRPAVYLQINLAAQLQRSLPDAAGTTTTTAASVPTEPIASPETIATILARAIRQAQQLDDRQAESYGLGQLGHLYERQGQWEDALQTTRQALLLAEAIGANEIAYRWHWQLGRLYRQTENAPENRAQAIAAYDSAIENLQAVRADLLALAPEVQFSFRDGVEPLYREYADLLLSPDATPAELERAITAIEDLQLAELENYFRSACVDVSFESIDPLMSEAAVIYPLLLRDRLEVIVAIPGQPLQHHTVAISQTEATAVLQDYLQSLNPVFSDRQRLQLSQQIHGWLIEPILPSLEAGGVQTLVYVPDGEFRNIPLSALHDGQRYLIEAFNIALTPGLQLIRAPELVQTTEAALTFGISEARQGFSALPGVDRELQAIGEQLSTLTLLNQEFTSAGLREQIERADSNILHLATHGQFSSAPAKTFLLAWDRTVAIDELGLWLKARNAERQTPFELLILSACQTAVGDNRATLGLAGLAVQSGVTSTVATLWGVNDESTAELIQSFYTSLTQANLTKGEALRQAQLELLQSSKYQHPYHWSSFVLVGNWN